MTVTEIGTAGTSIKIVELANPYQSGFPVGTLIEMNLVALKADVREYLVPNSPTHIERLREKFKNEFLHSSHGNPDFTDGSWEAVTHLGEGGFGIVGLWASLDKHNNIVDVREEI